MRSEKSYDGELMALGQSNEEIIMRWLQRFEAAREIIDFREFRLTQRLDVDCGIETLDGNIVLAEIKADRHIAADKNLLFENHRINHFAKGHWFYLGWGWRSPAQKLIIRNPETGKTFVFSFDDLREFIGGYVAEQGKSLRMAIVETDRQKTTFNLIVPFASIPAGLYKDYLVLG